jgi:hypothetical protein
MDGYCKMLFTEHHNIAESHLTAGRGPQNLAQQLEPAQGIQVPNKEENSLFHVAY